MKKINRKNVRRYAGVVILFYPDSNVLKNVASYASQLDLLIIYDNTDSSQGSAVLVALKKRFPSAVVLGNKKNNGIGCALNTAAAFAIKNKCTHLFTFDQDSSAEKGMMTALKRFSENALNDAVAIISPFHRGVTELPVGRPLIEYPDEVMTSGNLLNLSHFQTLGPFREDLFIDSVDTEFCLRARSNAFQVVRLNGAFLNHSLGNSRTLTGSLAGSFLARLFPSFAAKHLIVTNHSALRRYYITRNKLIVAMQYARMYPEFIKKIRRYLLESLVKVILFEKDSSKKIAMMWKGYRDFRRGIVGKYHEHN